MKSFTLRQSGLNSQVLDGNKIGNSLLTTGWPRECSDVTSTEFNNRVVGTPTTLVVGRQVYLPEIEISLA